ncbi:hypothetical protein [Desmospora activa]|uniref:Uncharacterized protein n=1 Tax=Desmospora activa DSM 45169 TaxID=1121389 RepID=A0A2T4ZDG2_9BACL|nr:hypothetical protein [Desmospora activa]PTM59938.1 hypothetical protein C8J48_2575 [Desmospora activa DSM 45169]
MKKWSIVLVAGCCLLLAACGNQWPQPSLERDLDAAAQKVIKSEEGIGQGSSLLRMSQIANFDWDYVYVFGPDTSGEEIKARMGIDWDQAEDLKEREENLLVFVKNNKVVRFVSHPLAKGEFADLQHPRTPGTAVFIAEREADGNQLIQPVNSGGN